MRIVETAQSLKLIDGLIGSDTLVKDFGSIELILHQMFSLEHTSKAPLSKLFIQHEVI